MGWVQGRGDGGGRYGEGTESRYPRGRENGCRKRVEGQGRDGRKEERSLFYMYLCMTVLILVIL